MQAKIRGVISIILVLISFSCVEKYNPVLENYENLMVVDGMFTNEIKSHSLKLFSTTNVYSTEYYPISGATVKVISSRGEEINFFELENTGEYFTEPNVQGEPGVQYKLQVMLLNSSIFETGYQVLNSSPQISTITYEREKKDTWEIGESLDGIQFFLTANNIPQETDYFLWQLEETFEYSAELFIDSYFAGSFYDFPDEDSLFICWKTNVLPEIYTLSLENSETNSIENLSLNYVSNESKRLSIRYSLLAKQYNLNEEAYNYWNTINELNIDDGELYNKQPYQVRGNLRSIENPNEFLLGYFTVAGVSTKRIFVDKPNEMEFSTSLCEPDSRALGYIVFTNPDEWPKYIAVKDNVRGVVSDFCVDCRVRGGDISKPDFWE